VHACNFEAYEHSQADGDGKKKRRLAGHFCVSRGSSTAYISIQSKRQWPTSLLTASFVVFTAVRTPSRLPKASQAAVRS
jgi:hypothetical protein